MIKFTENDVLFDEDSIRKQVSWLASKIIRDLGWPEKCPDHTIQVVGILQACRPFVADFMREVNRFGFVAKYDFLTCSTYLGGTEPSRLPDVKWNYQYPTDFDINKTVYLLDTVLDTGNTLSYSEAFLRMVGFSKIKTCVLVHKKDKTHESVVPDYWGFRVTANPFLIGYGLDYEGQYRSLPHIYITKMGGVE